MMEEMSTRTETSSRMPTTAAFVTPFLTTLTGRAVDVPSRNSIMDYGRQRRTISQPARDYVSRKIIVSSRLARQVLLRRRNSVVRATVPEKPTGKKDENTLVLKRTGMNTPMVLSKEMQEFVGHDMLARFQVMTHIGSYIKKHNLHKQGDKRRFVVDDVLSRLLGVEGDHTMLELQKLISKHLRHPKDMGPEYEERSYRIFENYLKERGAIDSKVAPRRKDPRGLNSQKTQQELRAKGMGMYADVMIDTCLQPICGGRDRMSRPEVLKAVWRYIKSHDLQDPQNRRSIIVDEGLRNGLRITDATSIDCFHIGRYLWKLCKDAKAQ